MPATYKYVIVPAELSNINHSLDQDKTLEIIFYARCRRGTQVEPPPTL